MAIKQRRRRYECVDCGGTARGSLPGLMEQPRCRDCREDTYGGDDD